MVQLYTISFGEQGTYVPVLGVSTYYKPQL